MSKTITIGGERLGAGGKMKEKLHGYGNSYHDLGYVWRNTMNAGTLVPFLRELLTNGDELDIDLNTIVRTHPTLGALYGSFKMQLDIFKCPIRYYNKMLHNNRKGIGLHMDTVYFPMMKLTAKNPDLSESNLNQQQINVSSLLHNLGISGIGRSSDIDATTVSRNFNAIPMLAYWDIYANYYANLQEEIGMCISHIGQSGGVITRLGVGNSNPPGTQDRTTEATQPTGTASSITVWGYIMPGSGATNYSGLLEVDGIGLGAGGVLFQIRNNDNAIIPIQVADNDPEWLACWNTVVRNPNGTQILYAGWKGGTIKGNDYSYMYIISTTQVAGVTTSVSSVQSPEIQLTPFPLKNIDDMRDAILAADESAPFQVEAAAGGVGNTLPYSAVTGTFISQGQTQANSSLAMQGLAVKTYQSDRFNNWLSSEWLDGVGGINEITAIDVSEGTLSMDALNLQQKIYNMLNRIAISGGSYKDWQESVYANHGIGDLEVPTFCGGASSEIIFNEVVSTAEAQSDGAAQPLGTLGGRGTQGRVKKNHVHIRANEPMYVIGIVSITPRVDYSQGNKYIYRHETMDDLHKPELDGIGFQELITDEMAAFDTVIDSETGKVNYKSIGKQPAYTEYTTNVNETHGNFANDNSEAFMALNRDYKAGLDGSIEDATTYIDPVKYNENFAVKEITAQNFWVQIGCEIKAKRVMSATQLPTL